MKKRLLVMLLSTFLISGLSAQTVLSSQNFSSGLGSWSSVTNNTAATKWVYSHNPIASPSFGNYTFKSPTASNGFALIMSDGNNSALNTDLISSAINCSGQNHVGLVFTQLFQPYYSNVIATVSVSTDSSSWTEVANMINISNFSNPELMQLDISSEAANQPQIWVKFHYEATNDLFWAVDDISVLGLPDNDAAVQSVDIQDYLPIGNNTITATIQNMGGTVLNNVTLDYSLDGGTSVSQTFSGLNLDPFAKAQVQFTAPSVVPTVDVHSYKIQSSQPNSTTDANPANDTLSKAIVSLSHIPAKNVLVEEFGTVPCGYCPGGATWISRLLAAQGSYTNAVTLHAGFGTDAMTTTEASSLSSTYDNNGAPAAMIDRQLLNGEDNLATGAPGLDYTDNVWGDYVQARQPILPPVSVSANNTFDSASRALTVNISATFYGPVTGNFRFNCYLIEDSVVGSGSGYDQHSYYYSSPTDTSLNPWYHVGTSNLGSGTWAIGGFVHNHVDRALLGGAAGSSGVIASPTVDGTTYTKTYTYTVPAGYRANKLKLIAFVNQYTSGVSSNKNQILNNVEMALNSADSNTVTTASLPTAIENVSSLEKIALYPNPAKDIVYLNYTLNENTRLSFDVYNTLGQLVTSLNETSINKGAVTTIINTSHFENGLYLVTVKGDGKVLQTLKFVVNK
ncbi:MAG TPA: Omp28-related outer membrane protein [Chitinophagales bacterium]|nr:Omp28-related outer membrane protein [Chitinophagales bacterium]